MNLGVRTCKQSCSGEACTWSMGRGATADALDGGDAQMVNKYRINFGIKLGMRPATFFELISRIDGRSDWLFCEVEEVLE